MDPVETANAKSGQSSVVLVEPAALSGGLSADVLWSLGPGVLVVDRALSVIYRNAAASTQLPAATELEEVFRNGRILGSFEGWAEELRSIMNAGTSRCFELALGGDGAEAPRVLSLQCTPLREGGGGRIRGVVIAIGDASQRAGLEERLAVSERLASIGKLASRVAHELNNPLDGILRYVNLSLRLIEDAPETKLKTYLDESRTGLMRMVRIIKELLEFSRVTHGQFDLVGINDLVDQSLREYAPSAQEHGIVLTADYQRPDMPAIRGGRLHQVCCNLLKNAIDVMPDGGRLTVTTGVVDEYVIIRIADTGPGLPAEPSKVFVPFYTTKELGEGTGLGLAICKDFIEDLGGTLEGSSGEDGGAVFTVRIPVARCHAGSLP
jgi:signal transduction histidine kinase